MPITAHFINTDFQLESALLDIKEFEAAHTGSNIAAELENVFNEWKPVWSECFI